MNTHTEAIARHHRHQDRFNLNLNSLYEVIVRPRFLDEGTLYMVIGHYSIYNHMESKVLFTAKREETAKDMADALTTLIETLERSDPEFVQTRG